MSGGHLNPAVTLAMATLKKCKWIQVSGCQFDDISVPKRPQFFELEVPTGL